MKLFQKALAVTALMGASALAQAGPITANQWYGFCFSGVGAGATAGCQNEAFGSTGNAFTFTLTAPGLLKVTDAFLFGDTFDVWVNGSLSFSTDGGSGVGTTLSNPYLAFDSGRYDAGSLALGIGSYSVELFVKEAPTGSGGAYLGVFDAPASTVPTPGTLSLVGLALLGGLALRRRAQA